MHRRQFLSSAALLPAVAGGSPDALVPRPVAGGLKLGAVTYNIAKDCDIPTLIARLSQTGFTERLWQLVGGRRIREREVRSGVLGRAGERSEERL